MANYINQKELEKEILLSKDAGKLTPKAIELLYRMIKEITRQMRYKYDEDKKDCMSEAMFDVLKYWERFDPNNPKANCFSYFTQLIKHGLAKGWKKIRPQKITQFVSISINSVQLNI